MIALADDDLDLVRASFRELAVDGAQAAATFYDRLFAVTPTLRPLFPADLDQQCTKLMSMLGAIVAQLHDHAALQPMLADLARRHAGYGARPAHYEHVGEALIWTLGRRLGDGFTADHAAAWRRAYGALSSTMIDATA
jgi:nitric oxide dioxygenase